MSTYFGLDTKLQGRCRESRKLANNTYARRRCSGQIAIQLHATDILTFHSDGQIDVNTGGCRLLRRTPVSDACRRVVSVRPYRKRMSQFPAGVYEDKRRAVKCKNCSGETEVHLIDCRAPFNTPERAARYCYRCRPEAMNPGQRTFVADLLDSYPIAERLKDLGRVKIQ